MALLFNACITSSNNSLNVSNFTSASISITCLLSLLSRSNALIVVHNLLYKAEKPSVYLFVCLSVCTFWHADNSTMSVWIEMRLARNESCVFEDHKVYFYKPIIPTVQ